MKSTNNYFEGGGAIRGWAVGLSMIGTAISSVTFLAYPGSAYSEDWSLLLPNLVFPIGAIIGAFVFVPFYRRTTFTTAFEFLEARYACNWLRTYGSFLFIIGTSWRLGSILYLVSLAISTLTGWSFLVVILVLGFSVTLYTVMGGIEAVIWTDVMQTLVLFAGGVSVIMMILLTVDGGAARVVHDGLQAGKFDLSLDFSLVLTRKTFWILSFSGLIGCVAEFAGDQTKIQRYNAAASEREAKKAAFFTGIACIPFWGMFMLVGTCLWVFYRAVQDPAVGQMKADQVFPHYIMTQLPEGFSGFVLAAVLAAAMSSLDSSMNSFGKVVTHDIYERLIVRDQTDKHYLNVGRLVTTVGGVLMMVVAWLTTLLDVDSLLYLGYVISSIISGGFGGFFLLAFFSTRANSQGVAIGIVAALLVSGYLTLSYFDMVAIHKETESRVEHKIEVLLNEGVLAEGITIPEELRNSLVEQAYKEMPASERGFRFLPETWRCDWHPFVISIAATIVAWVVAYLASFCFPRLSDEQLRGTTLWTV